MVFQNYALYPYLTVAANIGFPLRIAKVKKAEREKRVREVAKLLGLSEYLERKPGQLSGGQRQRVAMGRAIVRVPSVFLMDEPLSNLDAKLRVQMRADIAALQSDFGITTVYVTHDQAEAMTLGHRVAVLQRRAAAAVRPAARALRAPGERVRRRVHRLACDEPLHGAACANGAASFGGVDVPLPQGARANGRTSLVLGVRPEALEVATEGIPGEGRRRRGRRRRRVRLLHAPSSAGRRRSSSRAPRSRKAPKQGDACRCGRVPTRPTSSTRRAASGWTADDRGAPSRSAARANCSSRRSESSRRRSCGSSSTRPSSRPSRGDCASARRRSCGWSGHGSSDAAASYGVYAFGLLPGWTAMRDSISLTVYYEAKLDLSGSVVVALSQSGETPDVVEYVDACALARRVDGRGHERPGVRARPRGRRDAAARRPGRSAQSRRRRPSSTRSRPSRCSRAVRQGAGARSRTGCGAWRISWPMRSILSSSRGRRTSRWHSPTSGGCT